MVPTKDPKEATTASPNGSSIPVVPACSIRVSPSGEIRTAWHAKEVVHELFDPIARIGALLYAGRPNWDLLATSAARLVLNPRPSTWYVDGCPSDAAWCVELTCVEYTSLPAEPAGQRLFSARFTTSRIR